MQPDCKLMLPKSLENDAAIFQNRPKMKQNDAWDNSRRDFGGMLARSKLAEGFFDTPGRLWAPLGEPVGLPLASFIDFGKILAIVLDTFSYGLATFCITFPNPVFAQMFNGFAIVFETPAQCKK